MVAKLVGLPALLHLQLCCQGQLSSFAQLRGGASSPTPKPPEPGRRHSLSKRQADPAHLSATATTGKRQSHTACSHALRLTVSCSIPYPHHQGQLYHTAQVKGWGQPSASHANGDSSPMLMPSRQLYQSTTPMRGGPVLHSPLIQRGPTR